MILKDKLANDLILGKVRLFEAFKESEHPRASDGEFGDKAGSSKSKDSKSKGAKPDLSDKEKSVMSKYGEGNSYNVNKYLKDPKTAKAEAKKNFGARAGEYIKNMEASSKIIDGAIAKSKLEKDTKLFRGVSDFQHIRDAVANLKDGDTFSLPTFSSTSKDEKWARDFMNGKTGDKGMIVIDAKAGASALDMDDYARHRSEEQEMLLGRNAKFKFSKYDKATNTVHLVLDGEA